MKLIHNFGNFRQVTVMTAAMIIILLVVSCASKQIEVKHFKGYAEVYEGDEARLEWNFKNADKVRVEGLPGYYKPVDVVMVKPDETTKYNIIAYRDNDSLVVSGLVTVKQNSKPKGIRRGSTLLKALELKPSYLETDYFAGVIEAANSKGPSKIKVMRMNYPSSGQPGYTLQVLMMDQFGNYITNAVKTGPVPRWKAENTCEGIKSLQLMRDCNETYMSSQNIDLGIVLDNSAAAESNQNVFENIRDFVQYLSPTDNIMFSVYNNNYNEMLSLMPVEQALPEFENMELPARKGLNSIYKAAYNSIKTIGAGESPKKALVIITYNSDNSSVIYNANDIMKTARENKVPVYIIAVGSSVNTFILKYITQSTGSRLYAVAEDELDKIPNILREIWFAQKSYYELKLSVQNEYKDCKSLKTTLSCEMGESRILETMNVIIKPLMPYSLFQAVSSFDYRSSDIPADFNENIASLASYLKEHPSMNIELIGHSSIEGNMAYNNDVSLERAEKVKSQLIKSGIPAAQLKTRAEGCSKPVYYFEQTAWQSACNRRVEVRWLDPESLPFEIVAENLSTEGDAANKSEIWESLGYRSYYDRYLVNNQPVYRVKIWGYGTFDEASRAAKELEKKFNHAFNIE